MKWIKNNWVKILLVIVIMIIVFFYFISYYNQEKEEYRGYNDYERASVVMILTYNKDLHFEALRDVQSLNNEKKLSKGDLIYDFSQHDYLPILNYLNNSEVSDELINQFTKFLGFMSDYYFATIGRSENIFVRQSNGYYYTYDNEIYTYYVKMNVLGKKGLNSVYKEYLDANNYKSVEEKFLKNLYSLKVIKNEYDYEEMRNLILNNYEEFYSRNKKEILEVITSDLESFNNFLYTNYIKIDKNSNDAVILLKEIETEPLELTFDFKVFDRKYSSISKYYTHRYILDINDVWNQLETKGYPKLYA